MERPHRPRPTRPGFTLVELLVAILIIAALLAILLPAIGAAFRKAREASVSAEMNNLATALASFKNTYGDVPPSRIILPEQGFKTITTTGNGVGDSTTGSADMPDTALVQRSLLYLRRFWPRVNFNDPSTNPTSQKFFDFNGDGNPGGTLTLNGSECLTFFLGGLPIHSLDPNSGQTVVSGVSGFSKSPLNPFINSSGAIAGSTNRTVPNYEFVSGRLVDLDHDGIPSYLDPIDVSPGNRRAYAYFCAYGVNGYDPNDVNGYDHNTSLTVDYEFEDDPTNPGNADGVLVTRGFLVNFPVFTSGTQTASTYAYSPAPNPYTSGLPASGTVAWQNPSSYQILSAGADRQWGLGGQYVQNATSGSSLPVLSSDQGLVHAFDADDAIPRSGVRLRENDNITNFTSGRLQ